MRVCIGAFRQERALQQPSLASTGLPESLDATLDR
jgi:hypothetical protein